MKFIEFLGMPRAGKTTQINLLKKHLTKKGYGVHVVTDRARASKIKTPPTEVIGYKLVFFTQLIEEYHKYKNTVDYLIVDRGFYDAIVWFETEKILKHISPQRARELQRTFLEYQQLVDQCICLLTVPALAHQRHKQHTHRKVDDVAMQNTYLQTLYTSYRKCVKKFPRSISIEFTMSKTELFNHITSHII